MSIGVLLRGFIGDMIDFGDVIVRPLFPHFMSDQACTTGGLMNLCAGQSGREIAYISANDAEPRQ
jgi:hypothetical protein